MMCLARRSRGTTHPLAIDADIVDGRTWRAGKIARFTDDARNSQKSIIGSRPQRAAGASESAGEDAVPGKAVVVNRLCDKKSTKALLARSEGYEIVVKGSHWLLLLLKVQVAREHIRMRSAIAVALTQYDNDFC